MPETGLALSYLFALSQGNENDKKELSSYCNKVDIHLDDLLQEMIGKSDIYSLGNPEKHQLEAYPMVMSVLRAFRTTESYQNEVK